MLAAQPGEKGLGIKPPLGTRVGATEGGTGVRGMMDAPLTPLSFPRPASRPERASEMEESRLMMFSDNLRQFRVDTRNGLLPEKSSSMEVRGPEMDSCRPETVSEIWRGWGANGGMRRMLSEAGNRKVERGRDSESCGDKWLH